LPEKYESALVLSDARFQGITYGLWAKGCYTEAQRGQEFYKETIKIVYAWMSRWVNESPAEGPCKCT